MIKTFKNIILFFAGLIIVLSFSFSVKKINVINNSKNTDEEIIEQIFPTNISKNSLYCYITNNVFKKKDILYVDDYIVQFVNPVEVNIILKEKENYFYYSYLRINYYLNNQKMINEVRDETYENVPEVVNAYEVKRNKGDIVDVIGGVSVDDLMTISKTIKDLNVEYPNIDIEDKNNIIIKLGTVSVKIGDTKYLDLKMKRLSETFSYIRDMKGELNLSTISDKMKNERYIFKKA